MNKKIIYRWIWVLSAAALWVVAQLKLPRHIDPITLAELPKTIFWWRALLVGFFLLMWVAAAYFFRIGIGAIRWRKVNDKHEQLKEKPRWMATAVYFACAFVCLCSPFWIWIVSRQDVNQALALHSQLVSPGISKTSQ